MQPGAGKVLDEVMAMPRYKQPEHHIPESVEKAWREGGEESALEAIIVKYAKVLDMTDSGRDIKPLASGMLETIDRLKALQAADESRNRDTPLVTVLKMAANG